MFKECLTFFPTVLLSELPAAENQKRRQLGLIIVLARLCPCDIKIRAIWGWLDKPETKSCTQAQWLEPVWLRLNDESVSGFKRIAG